MSNKSVPPPSEGPNTDHRPVDAEGMSRRRLVRAGLSAAPVVLALKSNSVLASGGHICVKPSTFASLGGAAINRPNASQAPRINRGYTCYSHGYWKNNSAGLDPSNFKTITNFISATTGFQANPGGAFTGKTLQQVLEMGGNANNTALARHLTAAYLTARVYPGSALLSVGECQQIWNSPNNSWSPVPGDNTWNTQKWMDYFNFVLDGIIAP